jgi:hypothetical protein
MAAGAAYHRDAKPNRAVFRELREAYRRSGGATREMTEGTLAEHFRERLAGVRSYSEFMEAALSLDPDEWVPAEERRRLLALPGTIALRGEVRSTTRWRRGWGSPARASPRRRSGSWRRRASPPSTGR